MVDAIIFQSVATRVTSYDERTSIAYTRQKLLSARIELAYERKALYGWKRYSLQTLPENYIMI